MTAFTALLRAMIENLPEQSAGDRAAVYQRVRDKLIYQLEKRDPPLSEEQIQRQVTKMRDAILLIEQDYADS